MYKETFFNFRGILTSEKIAKNEKLQQNWFFDTSARRVKFFTLLYETIHSHFIN